MFALEHRVRVFVFQVLDRDVQYLLLRRKPASEWPLGPVVGPVELGEHLQDAVIREVAADTGIRRPLHIIELAPPAKELFGDVGLCEWPFAYQAGTPSRPIAEIRPGPEVGELGWMGFEEAFHRIDSPGDRESLIRLRLLLQAG
jgi:hypothetical protein